jgi:hypothetical protein
MAYLNQLAIVMERVHTLGFWSAISPSYNQSTVFLPWFFGAFLAYFTEPSRLLGIAIQTPLLALQFMMGYRYFKVTGLSKWYSLLFSIPLISYPAIFSFNGGLNDFRMDLSQALIYGSFLASLMIARKGQKISEWVLVGFIVSLGCLFRATTPVYVFFVLSFTLILDLKRQEIAFTLTRYSILSFVIILLSGWFYLLNFEHLHYYYFVWNTDANANLPIVESIKHLFFIRDHLGYPLIFALVLACLYSFVKLSNNKNLTHINQNYVALFGSLVPILYLVISGSGLNPFVSIIAVPGLILFALSFSQNCRIFEKNITNRFFVVALIFCFTFSIGYAVQNSFKQISIWIPYKSGITQVWQSIKANAKLTGDNNIVISFLYLGSVNDDVVTNHLVYEEGFRLDSKLKLSNNEITVAPLKFKVGALANWINIPGYTDKDKVNYLIGISIAKSDYIVMADEGSDLPEQHIINNYANHIRGFLETSPNVEKIKSHIILSGTEYASIYKIKR